jgi:MFS family permease
MRLRRSPLGPDETTLLDANIRHLLWDITWFGVLVGLAVNYIQLYVVRLGGSSLAVSALTYGPALVSIAWQLPAARMMARAGHRRRWFIGGGLLYRLPYLLVALIPFFFPAASIQLTVLVIILQAFALALSNVSFLSMLADVVPATRMTEVVGWRMACYGLTTTVSTLLAGPVLQRLGFPLNFQTIFILGFLASLCSTWHVSRIKVPDRDPVPVDKRHRSSDARKALRYPRFGRFALDVGILQLTIGMLTPLLPLFYVQQLGATDGQISIIVTVSSASMVLGSLLMRRTVRRIGRELALAAGALGYACYPLAASLASSVWWMIPCAALGGFFTAAITVTLFDNLVSTTPDADRSSYIAVYNVFVNVALFIGPLTAAFLAASAGGPRLGLRVAGAIGLVAGALLYFRFRQAQTEQRTRVEPA